MRDLIAELQELAHGRPEVLDLPVVVASDYDVEEPDPIIEEPNWRFGIRVRRVRL